MNHPLMQEEIFGPILPILTFEKRDEIAKIIEKNALPLACYLFSNDINFQKYFNTKLKYGGGAINDTIAHLGNPNLPFGGIATSVIGAYHGKSSFETFSHIKYNEEKLFFRCPLRYPPYTDKLKWLKKVLLILLQKKTAIKGCLKKTDAVFTPHHFVMVSIKTC